MAPAIPGALFSSLSIGLATVALAVAVFVIYSPALNYQFVLDDHRFISDPRLQSPGHLWEYFTSYVWAQIPGGPLSFYRPFFVLWMRLNFILSGMSPWGWHLLSIAKHVSVAVLLGLLVWKLLQDRIAALIAGALFALHPAQTESVAWVTVPDPLMSAAVLGTLLLFLRYQEHSEVKQLREEQLRKKSRKQIHSKSKNDFSVVWITASVITCLAALMAKETAIVLPVILFALALIVPFGKVGEDQAQGAKSLNSRTRAISAFRETLPFLCATVIYLFLRVNALKGQSIALTQHLPWSTVLLSWPATLWFYVKVLLWPVRSYAFADPSLTETFSLRNVFLPGLGVCCAVAILVTGCIWACRKAKRDLPDREAANVGRALLLGCFLLIFPILPALNLNALNPGDFLHGRYVYLPLTGLMLLAAIGWHLVKKGRLFLLSAAALVAVVCGILTVSQESMWKDDLTIFTVAHQMAPHNDPVAKNLTRAHVQVALSLDDAGRCDEALPIFEQAIQQYPQDWYAWAGRGECFFKLDDMPRAEQSLHRAFELSREPRVNEEWQQVRARMGLSSSSE
ncbi:MAG TPA: tetratricopeptide repeat protein [Terriglobales bacterium]|nr:tetratricopeptide repeat protein [Terriglobales bacterium]